MTFFHRHEGRSHESAGATFVVADNTRMIACTAIARARLEPVEAHWTLAQPAEALPARRLLKRMLRELTEDSVLTLSTGHILRGTLLVR